MRNTTPFFQAFGPLLFGRGPGSKIERIKPLDSLWELYEFFGEFLPDHLLSMSEEEPRAGLHSEGDLLGLRLPSARRGQCVPGCSAQGGGMVALDAEGARGRGGADSERLLPGPRKAGHADFETYPRAPGLEP